MMIGVWSEVLYRRLRSVKIRPDNGADFSTLTKQVAW